MNKAPSHWRRVCIVPDGKRWKLQTAISRCDFGPLAMKALGEPGVASDGLTVKAALTLGERLEAALESKSAERPRKGRQK